MLFDLTCCAMQLPSSDIRALDHIDSVQSTVIAAPTESFRPVQPSTTACACMKAGASTCSNGSHHIHARRGRAQASALRSLCGCARCVHLVAAPSSSSSMSCGYQALSQRTRVFACTARNRSLQHTKDIWCALATSLGLETAYSRYSTRVCPPLAAALTTGTRRRDAVPSSQSQSEPAVHQLQLSLRREQPLCTPSKPGTTATLQLQHHCSTTEHVCSIACKQEVTVPQSVVQESGLEAHHATPDGGCHVPVSARLLRLKL